MSLREIIDMGRTLFFDFEYPLWTDKPEFKELYGDFKPLFETLFLKFFFNYQICYEDFEMWNLDLDSALNLIMPYYNQLLESETWFDKFITNPANNTDYTEEYTRAIETNNDGYNENHTTNEGNNKQESSGVISTNNKTINDGKTASTDSTVSDQFSNSGNKTVSGTEGTNNLLPKNSLDPSIDYATDKSLNKAVAEGKSKSDGNTTTDSENTSYAKNTENSDTKAENENYIENENNSEIHGTNEFENKGNSEETYKFRRYGNIGTQTPGEVFTNTRKAFINTTKDIFMDPEIYTLFIQVY